MLICSNVGSATVTVAGTTVTIPPGEESNVTSELKALTRTQLAAIYEQRRKGLRFTWTSAELFDILPIRTTNDDPNIAILGRLQENDSDHDQWRNLVSKGVYRASFVVAAEAANMIDVEVSLKGFEGKVVRTNMMIPWYLADDATGATPSTVLPDGGVAMGAKGKLLPTGTVAQGSAVSDDVGVLNFQFTHAAGVLSGKYLVIVLGDCTVAVSPELSWA